MERMPRSAEGNFVYHVFNRGNARRTFPHKPTDLEGTKKETRTTPVPKVMSA